MSDARDDARPDDARAHARIEAALRDVGADLAPPAGWQARVLAAVAEPPPSPWRRWWKLALPAIPAVAALVVVLWWVNRPTEVAVVAELALQIESSGDHAVRGSSSEQSAQVGDVAIAKAAGSGRHRAVWIFRNQRKLVLACPGPSSDCQEQDGAVIGRLKLGLSGTYTLVALSSNEPIPIPTDDYDASLAAAAQAKQVPGLLEVR